MESETISTMNNKKTITTIHTSKELNPVPHEALFVSVHSAVQVRLVSAGQVAQIAGLHFVRAEIGELGHVAEVIKLRKKEKIKTNLHVSK